MKVPRPETSWTKLIEEQRNQSVSAAYCILNQNGELIYANKLMCLFLDTDSEKLLPKNQLVNPNFEQIKDLKQKTELIFEGLLTIGNSYDISYDLISRIFKKNDTFLVFADIDIIQLFGQNKKMSQLNQEVNNLHRQLLKEKSKLQASIKELKETQQMLIHSEKMNALGQLVAGVAHEINNPISFVTNNIYELEKYSNELISSYKHLEKEVSQEANPEMKDILKHLRTTNDLDYLEEDILEIIKESKEGVERVKKIVLDLRNFSRLDESEIKHIDLIENIHSTVSIINSEIQKKKIDFEMIADEKLMIHCYPGQLNQAILNILMNGIQAVDEKGKLSLSLEENEAEVEIRVEDNGCGIRKENLEKIFNPFYTTKPVGTGTGLGLSITYNIIEDLHKGKIEVESTENKGSVFTLKIPKVIENER